MPGGSQGRPAGVTGVYPGILLDPMRASGTFQGSPGSSSWGNSVIYFHNIIPQYNPVMLFCNIIPYYDPLV